MKHVMFDASWGGYLRSWSFMCHCLQWKREIKVWNIMYSVLSMCIFDIKWPRAQSECALQRIGDTWRGTGLERLLGNRWLRRRPKRLSSLTLPSPLIGQSDEVFAPTRCIVGMVAEVCCSWGSCLLVLFGWGQGSPVVLCLRINSWQDLIRVESIAFN